jgi:methionyl-tRNA synthetase
VLTDILKRWQKLCGDHRATLLTGTDEHGMKIQKAAQKANVEVKTFCNHHAQQFESLSQRANIDYDRFMRTTDEDHKAAVEHFWRELNHRGYIYESTHEGWYSVSDETFYPESQVHLVLDPATGRKLNASIETGKEAEWTSETNYHFKLSEFKDRLLEHYRNNPTFIVPSTRMNFITKEVEAGLTDLSVSRPASRLTWGIRVPNDESQTIYVWLDALINYLTMAGYPFATAEQSTALWPPNCQVIGKDIIRFHCIYWPAFLMALDLPLPKQFLSHAHWTMNREKMSKSSGNVVNPFFAIDRFDVDVMRYYMAHDGGIVDDADYENAYIIERYKKQLQGGFGNLLSRIVRSQKWNIRDSVKQAEIEIKSQQKLNHLDPAAAAQEEIIKKTAPLAAKKMKELNPRGSLHVIMELIYVVCARASCSQTRRELTCRRQTSISNIPMSGI